MYTSFILINNLTNRFLLEGRLIEVARTITPETILILLSFSQLLKQLDI